MKNLLLRTFTGILFVALLVGGIVGGRTTFFALFALITILAAWEFCGIVGRGGVAHPNQLFNAVGAYLVFHTAYAVSSLSGSAVLLIGCYVLVLLMLFAAQLLRSSRTPLQDLAASVMCHVYVGLPFGLLSVMAFGIRLPFFGAYSATLPLALFIFLWTNDTGAYCTGSVLHKRFPAKLAPHISPNKTIIGSTGGVVFTLVAAVIMWHFEPRLPLLVWLGFALVVCVAGTLGDLLESLFKRQLGIKDSGNILPGHGGMLDRFDSALLAIPASVLYFAAVILSGLLK